MTLDASLPVGVLRRVESSIDTTERVTELGVVAGLGAAHVFLRSCRRSKRCFDCLQADFSDEGFGERGGSGSYSVLQRLLCRGRNFPCTGLRGGVCSCVSLRLRSSDVHDKRRMKSSLLHDCNVHVGPSRLLKGERPVPLVRACSARLSSRLLGRETESDGIRA